MSIVQNVEAVATAIAGKAQGIIGEVIYAYTGFETSETLNQVVLFGLIAFAVYLSLLLMKPTEQVFRVEAKP